MRIGNFKFFIIQRRHPMFIRLPYHGEVYFDYRTQEVVTAVIGLHLILWALRWIYLAVVHLCPSRWDRMIDDIVYYRITEYERERKKHLHH